MPSSRLGFSCEACCRAGIFSRSARGATSVAAAAVREYYVARSSRLSVLAAVVAGDNEFATIEPHPASSPDATYAAKKTRVVELDEEASRAAARITPMVATLGATTGHVNSAVVADTSARVGWLTHQVLAAETRLEARRKALTQSTANAAARRDRLRADQVALAQATTALRRRRHSEQAVTDSNWAKINLAEFTRLRRDQLARLAALFMLTPRSIMNLQLPADGNYARVAPGNRRAVDLALYYLARFLEVAAELLGSAMPFRVADIGFVYGSQVALVDDCQPLEIKARKVNYNLCAIFAADGMDIAKLKPDIGTFFLALPSLAICLDVAQNPTLGTGRFLNSVPSTMADHDTAHSPCGCIGTIIEGPVGEDFVLL